MSVGAAPRLFHEIASPFQIFSVSSHLIEFAESHLDDGMAAGTMDLSFVRSERLAHQVGILDGHVEEIALSCGTVMCYGTLYQVAGIV